MRVGDITIDGATATQAHAVSLQPGWHRLRMRLTSRDNHGVRKQLQIHIGPHVETFHWNDTLRAERVIHLKTLVDTITAQWRHACGTHTLERFTLRPVTRLHAAASALTAKVSLLRQFNCLGPVVRRGGRMLLEGRIQEFRAKLMKGLPDQRTMSIEGKRADEAAAAWWRRRTLPAERRLQLQRDWVAWNNPVPVAVIIPVDATRVDHARQSVFSVLRQLYPHWQLRVLWPGTVAPPELENAIRREDRARIVTTRDGNLATALGCALADLPCDRVLMLSPDDELAEHALGLIAQGKARSVATEVKALARTIPERLLTAINVLKWTASATPLENASGEVVVQPLDAAQALAFRVPPPVQALSLHFSANFVGISGWDAVGFQMLRGLASRGVRVLAHPAAIVKPHVVPPAVAFPVMPRSPSQPQLIVAAPFQVKPFAPDERTAIFTMWECDRLATADVAVLNRAKVVIVPTAWGRDTFRASGVTVPIEVVPLGMDPLTYFPSGDTPSITTFGVAGALGAGGIRKNLAAAVDAFRAAFPTETNVKLRVKITPDCPPLDWPHDDRIDITRAVLPPAQVAAWYRSLTAFVNPSKAEGFGLHGLEAIACGVPLISTAATGVAEYFDATVGVVVPHTAEAVHNDYYRGQWFPPSVDGLADAMRRVFTDGTGAMGDAAAARARTFTWRNSVRTLHAVLAKHDLLEAA